MSSHLPMKVPNPEVNEEKSLYERSPRDEYGYVEHHRDTRPEFGYYFEKLRPLKARESLSSLWASPDDTNMIEKIFKYMKVGAGFGFYYGVVEQFRFHPRIASPVGRTILTAVYAARFSAVFGSIAAGETIMGTVRGKTDHYNLAAAGVLAGTVQGIHYGPAHGVKCMVAWMAVLLSVRVMKESMGFVILSDDARPDSRITEHWMRDKPFIGWRREITPETLQDFKI